MVSFCISIRKSGFGGTTNKPAKGQILEVKLWVPFLCGWILCFIYLIVSLFYPWIIGIKGGAFLILGFGITRYRYSILRRQKKFSEHEEKKIEKRLLITWVTGLIIISFGHLLGL